MGVVNVTPDSFSDGGRFFDEAAAVAHGLQLAADGADILDVGGESTRPGAEPVSEADEIARVVPVIAKLRADCGAAISVDTMKPGVARAAMAAGATIWNDVTSLRGDASSARVAAELGCGLILMHMQGEPRTMQLAPQYKDVVREVRTTLKDAAYVALKAGVKREKIWLDPGIGFGKTLAHNLALLKRLDVLMAAGFPVVLGVSRKSFIRTIDAQAETTADRIGGSLAAALWGASKGAHAIRVHDVRETRQALDVWERISDA
ncbi:MAG TPA: dihydropteroate synthase [Caulobacteraceae bacterium]|jgi:dihydropteroate synthase|nr:dihydropteroate synthase [Caulobacteraceae bacterium]